MVSIDLSFTYSECVEVPSYMQEMEVEPFSPVDVSLFLIYVQG